MPATMIPTEPIGSIPRPPELVAAIRGDAGMRELALLLDDAVRATVAAFEATGSSVISDGEQGKLENFWSYPVHGAANTAPDGFRIPLRSGAGGATHRMPRLTHGPFRYQRYADQYLRAARLHATQPVKQAIISPSALSLLYPPDGLPGYSREQFLDDLVREHETEIRRCLEAGAHKVQVDFAEPAGDAARPERRPAGQLRPPEQYGAGTLFRRRARPDRAARVGLRGRRNGRDRLRRTAAGAVRDPCRQLLYCDGRPARTRARAAHRARLRAPGPAHLRRRDRSRRSAHRERGTGTRPGPAGGTLPRPAPPGHDRRCRLRPFFDDDSVSRATAFAKVRARVEGTRLAAAVLERAA